MVIVFPRCMAGHTASTQGSPAKVNRLPRKSPTQTPSKMDRQILLYLDVVGQNHSSPGKFVLASHQHIRRGDALQGIRHRPCLTVHVDQALHDKKVNAIQKRGAREGGGEGGGGLNTRTELRKLLGQKRGVTSLKQLLNYLCACPYFLRLGFSKTDLLSRAMLPFFSFRATLQSSLHAMTMEIKPLLRFCHATAQSYSGSYRMAHAAP